MVKKLKKAFTITELVIVIAVIAILAAVLIPTFTSLISKANMSADQASVRDMNTALSADEILNGKPNSVLDAMLRMEENGYSFENYKPLSEDCVFVWHKDTNRILLLRITTADGKVEYKIEYPAGYEDVKVTGDDIGPNLAFQSLYLIEVGTDSETVNAYLTGKSSNVVDQNGNQAALTAASASNPVTIKIGQNGETETEIIEELSTVAAIVNGTFEDPMPLENVTISLPAEEINLGNTIWIPIGDSINAPFAGTVEGQTGETGKTVISGIDSAGYTASMANAMKLASGQIGVPYGFIGVMSGGTVKNVTLEDVHIDMSDSGVEMGGLIGLVNGKEEVTSAHVADVTIENCTVGSADENDDSAVIGQSKVGAIVGAIELAPRQGITISGCTNYADVTATSQGSSVRAGGIVGAFAAAYSYDETKGETSADTLPTDNQKIENCINYGTVTAKDYPSGICGHLYLGSGKVTVRFIDCENHGDIIVTGNDKQTGGQILGYHAFEGTLYVENCQAVVNEGVQLITTVSTPGDFFSAALSCTKPADFNLNSHKLVISYTEGSGTVSKQYGARLYGNTRGWYFTSKEEADRYPSLPTA